MQKESIHTKFKQNDQVVVLSGKDKGKTGRVIRVDSEKGRIVVEGINMVSKAKRKKNQQDQGGIIQIEAALAISNVAAVDSKGKATRIAYKGEGDAKVRIAVTTGEKL